MKRLAIALLLAATTRSAGASEAIVQHAAVATASRWATRAAVETMRRGGNAIDAAVTAAFVLSVTHPEAGALGGGGLLTYWDASSKAAWVLDFLPLSGSAATPETIAKAISAKPEDSNKLAVLSASVPGAVAGLFDAHARFGSLPWSDLIQPAIRIASEGFPVDAALEHDLATAQSERHIDRFAATAGLFFPGGKPLAAGTILKQSDLASSLSAIAKGGSKAFYDGAIAAALVADGKENGGLLSLTDFRSDSAIWRAPLEISYGSYTIIAPPAPSRGGVAIGETLAIAPGDQLRALDPGSAGFIHLLGEAQRRAAIDGRAFIGDPQLVRIAYDEIFSAERARSWRSTIGPRATPPDVIANGPAGRDHTTHISVVDTNGNVASITISLGEKFGSGWIAPGTGFFMNSEARFFDLSPIGAKDAPAKPNAIGPKRRTATPLTPIIVLKNHSPFLAAGASGGESIPSSLAELFIRLALFRQPLAGAIAAGRFHVAEDGEVTYEEQRLSQQSVLGLTLLSHPVKGVDALGEVQAIEIDGGRLVAVSDPRAGGAAGGF
jgi:gamma-glutamyltranspeptidase / glutathione hydrolase